MHPPEITTGAAAAGWRAEAGAMLALAWPLALTNLAQIALTATDTAFLGRHSTAALAAVTIGAALWWALLAPAFGIAFAAAAMLAQEHGRGGRGRVRRMRRTVRAALQGGLLACLPSALAIWHAEPVLLALGQDPALAALAQDYLRAMIWGLPGFLAFLVLRGFLAALERPRPALAVSLLAIGLNAALGWALIFGHAGLPALGVAGAGQASAASELFMAAALAALCARDRRLRRYRLAGRLWRWDGARLAELARLGAPITVQMALEIGMFGAVGLLMGQLGAAAVAAHAVALQLSGLSFMVPLGVGQAATARVGAAAGAGRPVALRRAGWIAIGLGAGFMALAALAMLLLPGRLAGLFLRLEGAEGAAVAGLAAQLVMIAGLFQLGDGVQSVAGGALRGLQDTRVPMLFAAGGYWLLGLPLGWALAMPLGLGPPGVWTGLAVGITLVAGLMTWRWSRLSRGAGAGFGRMAWHRQARPSGGAG
ncbi:MATE family efflux transporter [Roseomonas sp. OT10]|uniref:MATE family efflux transporter n=1 Tax=Roseomonas cutis TaxID=2897332 RepID=UPI001E50B46D|nr:MATE family efflux transporter [Roseomonas sp. OT10]UFN48756.1 MATE family efflux transporter [Roseomonas sp. OT10]